MTIEAGSVQYSATGAGSLFAAIFADAPGSAGAAWQKTAKDTERDYLSVKLDDPSFPAQIYATLIEVEGQDGLQLIWSRPNRD
ncbi:DUF736 domain-containing protein [Bradyrhizobium sp. Ash2021]|jgi:uncharacterized protein (DUF736 family)|uniref:DUF736 domain-containing protein n=1 Tax=Bradyrhizobium sp. Ash2021 TaxID=2954771 RepID=UPI0029252024|nr:DUF736 family protein [Bradyrhizobium sp. Ash2021]